MKDASDIEKVLHASPVSPPPSGFVRIRITDVLGWVDKMREHIASSGRGAWVFRGQANAEWPIRSTFDRLIKEHDPREQGCSSLPLEAITGEVSSDEIKLIEVERCLINTFVNHFQSHLPDGYRPTCALEWVALMQHYGVPTRLIDFTRNPETALHFATYEEHDSGYSVWMINASKAMDVRVYGMLEHSDGANDNPPDIESLFTAKFDDLEPILMANYFARVEIANPCMRMKAQEGLFLMSFRLSLPVDKMFRIYSAEETVSQALQKSLGNNFCYTQESAFKNWDEVCRRNVIEFVFDESTRNDARSYLLYERGIDRFALFPDDALASVSKILSRRFKKIEMPTLSKEPSWPF